MDNTVIQLAERKLVRLCGQQTQHFLQRWRTSLVRGGLIPEGVAMAVAWHVSCTPVERSFCHGDGQIWRLQDTFVTAMGKFGCCCEGHGGRRWREWGHQTRVVMSGPRGRARPRRPVVAHTTPTDRPRVKWRVCAHAAGANVAERRARALARASATRVDSTRLDAT